MSDIVERLRAPAYWFSGSSEGHEGENSAPYEAADEIERLRAALQKILSVPANWGSEVYDIEEIARAALEEK